MPEPIINVPTAYRELIRGAARRHGVPENILALIMQAESGWNSRAVGDRGTSFGLAQIHLPAHPGITREAAFNPAFAIDWTARRLGGAYRRYNGNEAATILYHNAPAAAEYLARTGKFGPTQRLADNSQRYLGLVLRPAGGLRNLPYGGERGTMNLPTTSGMDAFAYIMPVQGARISSAFGDSRDGGHREHAGIDFAAGEGTPVRAAFSGTVTRVSSSARGYGNQVMVRGDDGFVHRYAHLSSSEVKVGQKVSTGEHIGKVGSTGTSTGPHLHFEMIRNGKMVDPQPYLAGTMSKMGYAEGEPALGMTREQLASAPTSDPIVSFLNAMDVIGSVQEQELAPEGIEARQAEETRAREQFAAGVRTGVE